MIRILLFIFFFNPILPSNKDSLLTNVFFSSDLNIIDLNEFNFTYDYNPSNSYWALSFEENVVFKSMLQYNNLIDESKGYVIRIGKGGQIYSFKNILGELVPPQWRHPNWVEANYGGGTSYAPWVDEVWQIVCVDGQLNNPPDSSYFIHQSGVYLKTPEQNQPFYSPILAEYYNSDANSFSIINWGQQAHTEDNQNTNFQSNLLYYTKYTNVGQGIIQVDNMIYNFGLDNITFLNIPWGGVRNSVMDFFFISNSDNTYSLSTAIYGNGPVVQTSSTAGWLAWSNDSLGNGPTLGMAHPTRTNTSNSVFRYGDAGNLSAEWNDRDYHVFEMIRFPNENQLNFGKSMSFRYFYILGANVEQVKNIIIENNLVNNALDTSYTAFINDVDSIGYEFDNIGSSIVYGVNQLEPNLFLKAIPYQNSYPLFNIKSEDSVSYISSNPYYLSNIPHDGTLADIELLGFIDKPSNLVVKNDTVCYNSSYLFPDNSYQEYINFDTIYVSTIPSLSVGWDSLIVSKIYVNDIIKGDYVSDCELNVLDIIAIIELIFLTNIFNSTQLLINDLNNDFLINVIDIVMIIDIILDN